MHFKSKLQSAEAAGMLMHICSDRLDMPKLRFENFSTFASTQQTSLQLSFKKIAENAISIISFLRCNNFSWPQVSGQEIKVI